MGTEISIRSAPIPLLADLLREVENDGNRQHMELACQSNQRLSGVRLHVRSIDNGQPPRSQTLPGDEVQDLERLLGRGLVVFVIRYQTATVIRRQDFRWLEMLASKGRFSAARRTDEQD